MNKNMLAVTIGVGPEGDELAPMAAKLVEKNLGLETRILNADHYRRSGCDHICFLKLDLFDLFPDVENILYFDADLMFIRPWEPMRFVDRAEFIGVRDINYASWIRSDCAAHRIPSNDYINAGLFIANRTHHTTMFELAKQLAPNRQGELYDQTVLNWARVLLDIPALHLSKLLNWVSYRSELHARRLFPVIGAHLKYREPAEKKFLHYLAQVDSSTPCLIGDRDLEAEAQIGDKLWFYDRIDHDHRLVQLLSDNTVGFGMAQCEQYWFVESQTSGPELVICSDQGITCRLRQASHDRWKGRWLIGEKMEVELRYSATESLDLTPAELVLEGLRNRLVHSSPIRGAYVGQHAVDVTPTILAGLSTLELEIVAEQVADTTQIPGLIANVPASLRSTRSILHGHQNIFDVTLFADRRRRFSPYPISVAAHGYENTSFDFVVIDVDDPDQLQQLVSDWQGRIRRDGTIVIVDRHGVEPILSQNTTSLDAERILVLRPNVSVQSREYETLRSV